MVTSMEEETGLVKKSKNCQSKNLLKEVCEMGCALICDALFALGFKNQYMRGIKPIISGRFAGPAVTVRYIPWREDLPEILRFKPEERSELADFKSIETAKEGEVIVCDCRGLIEGSAFGDVMTLRCKIRGIAGIVIDGAVRDIPGLKPLKVPIYAKGVHCYPGPKGIHPIDLNVPISCGEVAVLPGDIIVGDDDGVVVIPKKVLKEVVKIAKEREEMEAFVRKMLEEEKVELGEYYPPREKTRQAMRSKQAKR
jgi:regulator of RNase E activity RraA